VFRARDDAPRGVPGIGGIAGLADRALFHRRVFGAANAVEHAFPARAEGRRQQGVHVGAAGGGDDGEPQPIRLRFIDEPRHAGAQAHPSCGHGLGVTAGLDPMQGGDEAVGVAKFEHIGVVLGEKMPDAFLAARGLE